MSRSDEDPVYIGISEGPCDPSVAAVRAGQVIAYCEEERLARVKHAYGIYPIRSLRYCLEAAGVTLDEVAAVSVGWNLEAYSDGGMARFYGRLAEEWNLDEATSAWQAGNLRTYDLTNTEARHVLRWRREFGDIEFPPIRWAPHHYTHAFQASAESPFDTAITLTLDGSGDEHTMVVWRYQGGDLTPLREIRMPHSLGWYYAAFTEYLGFDAYDGEYKVMGLAAHGRPVPAIRRLVDQVLTTAPDGVEFRVDPTYIHHGEHTYSARFTDNLVKLFGVAPRLPRQEVTEWHMDVARAVQDALEDAVCRIVLDAVAATGIRTVCVGGGVGLNVKLSSRIFELDEVDDVFAHPLCADNGTAAGAALVTCHQDTGARPLPLTSLALGPHEDAAAIERVLRAARVPFTEPEDAIALTARELASGAIVGWMDGRLEAGPRALGQRSILADPRRAESRDRINSAVKYRELWRPFAPVLPADAAGRYFDHWTMSRFMTMAFRANDRMKAEAPAAVHVDGTARAQLVDPAANPAMSRLLAEFGAITGVPVLVNTSFNVRGEAIVNTTEDALRTFWATGLDMLVLGGRFVVRKR